ncbi:MAG: endonuclease/exonuclease/phosphatase family protein [Spirochaetales bacterium]|nr:endonuclease/exonuclease/phosphatase family protein [Spirochaetales bacterium]
MKKKWLFIPLLSLFVLALLALGVLLICTVTAYSPSRISAPEAYGMPQEKLAGNQINLITWNLGYGGLDAQTDFLLDGGSMSHPRSLEAVAQNHDAFVKWLREANADALFLQEVEKSSARTWNYPGTRTLQEALTGYASWFAPNFRSPFVPFPLSQPLGRIDSGIMTFSQFATTGAERHQLPGSYPWPIHVFHLKRCALVVRLPSDRPGRDWILINLHLSAYDSGGTLRSAQLAYVKELIQKYAAEGHDVVVGGDWNSLFPGVSRNQFPNYSTTEENLYWVQRIPDDFTPEGWTWAYDPNSSTCRSLDAPYQKGENYECIIDGFLLSPGLQIDSIKGANLGYMNSDHDPVRLTVSRK